MKTFLVTFSRFLSNQPWSELKGKLGWMICPLILLSVSTACLPLQPRTTLLTPTAIPTESFIWDADGSDFSLEQISTLKSLEQVDDYPLYTMIYVGDYNGELSNRDFDKDFFLTQESNQYYWSCSLFAALGKPDGMLFGRNFDWKHSPALLLFTDPSFGYASVSIVDIAYLIDNLGHARELMNLDTEELKGLLDAPFLPFDGMNEYGLTIGMAAVPSGQAPTQPSKRSVGSLRVIRQILDHASNVSEAVDIFRRFDIDFSGGPDLHYLIADAQGKSAVVEYYQSEMVVEYSQKPWQQATNFIIASEGESANDRCWRYDTLDQKLNEVEGVLNFESAFELLSDVSQSNTQWSVVYGLNTGLIGVVMGRDFGDIYEFRLNLISN
jgi:hypothetical protein